MSTTHRGSTSCAAALPCIVVLGLASGCSLLTPFRVNDRADAGDDASADADTSGDSGPDARADARTDAQTDADTDAAPLGAGAMTFVVDWQALDTDRLCDLDGDGSPDNSVADLGGDAAVFAMAVDIQLQTRIDTGFRTLLHLPWVEDRDSPHDPDVVLLVFRGKDLDDPLDFSDDFSGEEPFWAWWRFVDECGEPRFALRDTSLDAGDLVASDGMTFFWFGDLAPVHTATVRASLEPRGRGMELRSCGVATIRDLGTVHQTDGTGLTMLEAFIAGGSAFGLPTVPGLTPDIDVDGDGLEQIVLDTDSRVVRCVDGDRYVVPGPDCWMDPRIADGFSITLKATAVPARFAGLEPDWARRYEGGCPEPPEESLFDPR